MDIPHTREVFSTLPKEHRLRCQRASGITGGGSDRDDSQEWNRERHPWTKENGNDIEAVAWHTLDSTLFKREKNFWEAQCSSLCSPFNFSASSTLTPSAAAAHYSGIIQDVHPFDNDCINTPSKRAGAKGAASQEITCFSVCRGRADKVHQADCNEHQLFPCPVSGAPDQQPLSFHHLSFPLRSLLTCWKQRMAALQFETSLTASPKKNLMVWMAMFRCFKISPAAQNKKFFEVSSLLFPVGSLAAERRQQSCSYRVKQCKYAPNKQLYLDLVAV